MIRINLLTAERAAAKKTRFAFSLSAQKMPLLASLILVITGGGIGWRYYALINESRKLDDEITAAQQETARLHSVIQQVQQFEQRRAQLQQRVALIEELRRGQTGPVHMLDQVSRALPPMLWLTELKQVNAEGVVQIDGRATSQTTVSDFVTNLEATGYFRKSIDIVNTTLEAMPQPPGELVRFTLRAIFQTPAEQKAAAEKAAAAGAARTAPAAKPAAEPKK